MPARLLRPASLASLLAAVLLSPAHAQPAPEGQAQDEARRPEPAVERLRVEDEGSRIEELRVRGQTRHIRVQPRHGAGYEVLPIDAGRDPSQGHGLGGGSRGAHGQRVWPFLSF